MSVINLLKFITTHPLNRDKKIASIIRFAKWQIGSRLVPGAVVYDWVNGSRFLVRTGETGLTGNIYTGLHEFTDMAFLLHFLRTDDLFIDVGANVGSYTILACSALLCPALPCPALPCPALPCPALPCPARSARGYAFEPVPSTYKKLTENIRLNHLENRVQCFNIGLSSEKGEIVFTSDMDTTNHALASGEQSANTITVEVSTLDCVLGSESPALMKIDVEGYETPVLKGALETLKKQSLKSVIMELNGSGSRYGFDESRILEMMFDHGFKTYSYDPFTRTLINLQGKNLDSGNTLFIRDNEYVLDRLKSSPKITIHGKQF